MNNGKAAPALDWWKLHWNVHYESDREGHYLVFSARVPQVGKNEHGEWGCTGLAYTGNVFPGSIPDDLLKDLRATLKHGEPHPE